MVFSPFRSCLLHLSLISSLEYFAAQSVNSTSSLCRDAFVAPRIQPPCVALQHNTYCKSRKIPLDPFVFASKEDQRKRDQRLTTFDSSLKRYAVFFSLSDACREAFDFVYCHHYFPRCDSTTDVLKAEPLCKKTCKYFKKTCASELATLRLVAPLLGASVSIDIIQCTGLLLRNAGASPQCYYFVGKNYGKGSSKSRVSTLKECLQADGSSYQGNISLTSSGTRCQSWTSQCPHRHDMNSTYPELKNASNFCRNPRGSGRRPWCFTTDPQKRWEYCDIPKCPSATTPVTGTVLPKTASLTTKTTAPPAKTPRTSTTIKTYYSSTRAATCGTEYSATTTSPSVAPSQLDVNTAANTTMRTCLPAEPLPRLQHWNRCTPLYPKSARYCKKRGVLLDSHVFRTAAEQKKYTKNLDRFILAELIVLGFAEFRISKRCRRAADPVYCRHYFPSCDRTSGQFKEQQLCRETCDYMWRSCKKEFAVAKRINAEIDLVPEWTYFWDLINCTLLPVRNAGASPECWYHVEENFAEDCVYLSGANYQGEISETSSGIPCQSWTTQCPHRHTMVSTYPELKNASNFCRNPGGSGQRPWCFTTDKNKRWEYCDISAKCPPGH